MFDFTIFLSLVEKVRSLDKGIRRIKEYEEEGMNRRTDYEI